MIDREDIASYLGSETWIELITRLYSEMGTTKIGTYLGVFTRLIASDLKRAGVKMRGIGGPNYHGIPVTANGVTYPGISSAARAYGLPPDLVHGRVQRGIPLEQALL